MTLPELLKLADADDPNHRFAEYLNLEYGTWSIRLHHGHPDSMPPDIDLLIVQIGRDLIRTYDPEASTIDQLIEARRVCEHASLRLAKLSGAFHKARADVKFSRIVAAGLAAIERKLSNT